MRRHRSRRGARGGALGGALICALWLAGCSGDDASDAAGGSGVYCEEDVDCGAGYVCAYNACVYQGEPADAGVGGPVDEADLDALGFSPPSAAEGRVWITSPSQDTAIYIDGISLEIGLVEVGRRPTLVEALPSGEGAVVLNEGSDEVSIVTLAAGEADVIHVPLAGYYNRMSLSPDGGYVVCWFTLTPDLESLPSTLQSAQVIDLQRLTAHTVAIGFNPSEVAFDAASAEALVITEDGLSVFPLAPTDEAGDPVEGPQVARTLPLAPSSVAIGPREVYLTADRAQAWSLGAGEAGVAVLDIAEGALGWVELSSAPTDLDLDPKGRWAVITLGAESAVAKVALDDPEEIELLPTGGPFNAAALGPDGRFAVLFEAGASAPVIGVMALEDEAAPIIVRRLRKAVDGVKIAPGGEVAFIRHVAEPGQGAPESEAEILARSHGWSLMRLSTLYTKLHTTPALPLGPVFDEARVLVMLKDDLAGVARLQIAGLEAFELTDLALGASPEAAGVLPAAHRAFVTQSDPNGRISFFDFETGRLSTLGGYVLNSRVR